MKQGTVVSFDDHRGSGYIKCEETGQEVYVHWTSIRRDLKSLSPGEAVKFKEFTFSGQATRQALEVW